MGAKTALKRVYRPVYPSPAALVTSVSTKGMPNIITLGEVFNISIASPVIVGIAIRPQRYSYGLIRETGEFVVNFPTRDIADKVTLCGRCSGRDTDKFALTGFTPLAGLHVLPPLIKECPVNLECKLLDVTRIGDHDLFTGEVVAQHVDEDVLNPDGSINAGKLKSFAFMLDQYFAIGGPIEGWR